MRHSQKYNYLHRANDIIFWYLFSDYLLKYPNDFLEIMFRIIQSRFVIKNLGYKRSKIMVYFIEDCNYINKKTLIEILKLQVLEIMNLKNWDQ